MPSVFWRAGRRESGPRPKTKSLSSSQILPRDYSFDEAKTVMKEMVIRGCQELMRRRLIAGGIWIGVGYSHDEAPQGHGSARLTGATARISAIEPFVLELYDKIALRDKKIRRLAIAFSGVCGEECEGYDIFTDRDAVNVNEKVNHMTMNF